MRRLLFILFSLSTTCLLLQYVSPFSFSFVISDKQHRVSDDSVYMVTVCCCNGLWRWLMWLWDVVVECCGMWLWDDVVVECSVEWVWYRWDMCKVCGVGGMWLWDVVVVCGGGMCWWDVVVGRGCGMWCVACGGEVW